MDRRLDGVKRLTRGFPAGVRLGAQSSRTGLGACGSERQPPPHLPMGRTTVPGAHKIRLTGTIHHAAKNRPPRPQLGVQHSVSPRLGCDAASSVDRDVAASCSYRPPPPSPRSSAYPTRWLSTGDRSRAAGTQLRSLLRCTSNFCLWVELSSRPYAASLANALSGANTTTPHRRRMGELNGSCRSGVAAGRYFTILTAPTKSARTPRAG